MSFLSMLGLMLHRSIFVALTFLLLNGCAQHIVIADTPAKEPSSKYLERVHPKVVLVLGSGSARGFAHAGVLKVLKEQHIPIDLIVGTSAGSIVGALYADNPNPDSLNKLLLTASRDEVIDFSYLNLFYGPVSGAGLQKFLTQNLHAKTFEQLQIPFIAVAADLETGKAHPFASGPIAPAVNASSAAPPYFRPVKMYGKVYADGGLIDPVAVDVARRFNPPLIIAVKLDYTLGKELPSNSPATFLRSFEMMLLKLYDNSAKHADVVIRPDTGNLNMFEEKGRERIIRAGEVAAYKMLPTIKKLMRERNIPYTK